MTKAVAEIAKEITGKIGGNGNGNGNGKPAPEAQTPQTETPTVEVPVPAPVPAAPELKKELSIVEKILKIENLQLVISKRQKLIETYSLLERFQLGSNDFNCSLRLSDSDGNVFNTSFSPGIKKVIEFLKMSFEKSIEETEQQINF
jgi:hypothetical protein